MAELCSLLTILLAGFVYLIMYQTKKSVFESLTLTFVALLSGMLFFNQIDMAKLVVFFAMALQSGAIGLYMITKQKENAVHGSNCLMLLLVFLVVFGWQLRVVTPFRFNWF